MDKVYLSIKNISKEFPAGEGLFRASKLRLKAVNNVSLDVYKGKTLGLVGESGCGKSTLGRCILRLTEPEKGEVIYNGIDLLRMDKNNFRKFRKKFQIIFQDPYSSLNPRMTVGDILTEIIKFHSEKSSADTRKKCFELLNVTGLTRNSINKYPHEFSGGQRQRIAIARALAVEPEFIVCDEPVSALDVSIQSQIINLLKELQSEFGLTYLFISHDLSVVKHISDYIAVMYLGKVTEYSDKNKLFENTYHPYTKSLLDAVPVPEPGFRRERIKLKGEIPNPVNPPGGCAFHTRCPVKISDCEKTFPEKYGDENHYAYCHLMKNL
ncbi:MAG: ATP-binding cassette domain-containing protein [Bacteroidetes bacterium]|nr:ATP-binding cassette domain-containing protein [Bacteroidota bacterium]